MDYKLVVTRDAERDFDRFIDYLLVEKGNFQAARNMIDDYVATIDTLKSVAGSLKLCDNPGLRQRGYHRIRFLKHRYFMLYRIEDDVVFIDKIFHELQDYENKMI